MCFFFRIFRLCGIHWACASSVFNWKQNEKKNVHFALSERKNHTNGKKNTKKWNKNIKWNAVKVAWEICLKMNGWASAMWRNQMISAWIYLSNEFVVVVAVEHCILLDILLFFLLLFLRYDVSFVLYFHVLGRILVCYFVCLFGGVTFTKKKKISHQTARVKIFFYIQNNFQSQRNLIQIFDISI